ncbi:C-5 cytosine-specific DNA methylase [Asimina triloba]
MEAKGLSKCESDPWTVLEFYSGIGGMMYSLREAGIPATVVEAFDINDTANDVYEFNFGHRPHQSFFIQLERGVVATASRFMNSQTILSDSKPAELYPISSLGCNVQFLVLSTAKGNIQSFTASDLDKYGADAWLLSPPCQPYTRQGLQKHSEDARALSFIKILELIPHMVHPPLFLFVENVVGFELDFGDCTKSFLSHQKVCKIITSLPVRLNLTGMAHSGAMSGSAQQLWELTKSMSLRDGSNWHAKRKPSSFQNPCYNYKLLWYPPPFLSCEKSLEAAKGNHDNEKLEELKLSCLPIKHFLETQTFSDDGSIHSASMGDIAVDVEEGDGENVSGCCFLDLYSVPSSLIDRWGTAMVKVDPSIIKDLGLRYFTPREVANLHSFPEDFCFPKHITLRQRYALLGNSLSVAVVAPLLQLSVALVMVKGFDGESLVNKQSITSGKFASICLQTCTAINPMTENSAASKHPKGKPLLDSSSFMSYLSPLSFMKRFSSYFAYSMLGLHESSKLSAYIQQGQGTGSVVPVQKGPERWRTPDGRLEAHQLHVGLGLFPFKPWEAHYHGAGSWMSNKSSGLYG